MRARAAVLSAFATAFLAASAALFFKSGKPAPAGAAEFGLVRTVKAGEFVTDVMVSDGGVYAACDNSKVAKFDLSGRLLWERRLENFEISSKLGAAGGAVLAASDEGEVVALSGADGSFLWKFTAGDKVCGGFAEHGGLVVFAAFDGGIYALSASNGRKAFSVKTSDAVNGGCALAGGRAVFGNCAGDVVCVDLDAGKAAWEAKFGSHIPASPVACGGYAAVSDYSGDVAAYSFSSGEKLWEASLGASPRTQPAAFMDMLAFVDSGGTLRLAGPAGDAREAAFFGEPAAFLKADSGELMAALKDGRIFVFRGREARRVFSADASMTLECADFSGGCIAAGDSDGGIHIYKRM